MCVVIPVPSSALEICLLNVWLAWANEVLPSSKSWFLMHFCTDKDGAEHLQLLLSHSPAEVPPAARPEEEESGEVRDGRDDCGAADLHRVVPAPLHVPREVRSRSREPAAGCFIWDHPGRLSGADMAFFIKPSESKQVFKSFSEMKRHEERFDENKQTTTTDDNNNNNNIE